MIKMSQHTRGLILTATKFKDRKSACLKCAGSKLCYKHIRLKKHMGKKMKDIPENLLM